MNKEEAKQKIKELVDKYNGIKQEGKIARYKEEDTKVEFIDPLFEALGWDVYNRFHDDEVIREEKISKGRVDYSFRINGIPKFFLEAKALKEDLENRQFVQQTIDYAWHKGCTWAVLTNFESIKIFNAEWKSPNPLQAQMCQTLPCHLFIEHFEQLCFLSKESLEQGLLDKEADKWRKKIKKVPIDKQLLADFTRFRDLLSKNLVKLNSSKVELGADLEEAVQRILDRLIFIRNCEDRGLEEKKLLPNLRDWMSRGRGQLIKALREIFAYFDGEYNSKIFRPHLCDQVDIGNDVLAEIIEGLYYPKDKSVYYDFSFIEADVLGNIYEQYLGHILKKTEKRAKLTESQNHRKEQGIYYTPTYIVDYIVRNTLGELLKNKKVDVNKIRVLDPACGSGSFLIKAFDVLNEWHAKYNKNYHDKTIGHDGNGYSIKENILMNNIFGVDLDKQAVEIAQLNLFLKIAEKGHQLPLLQQNIRCGNSLIDDSAVAGDKAFKWEEQFKEIMKAGGFDVVVGNPPYVNVYNMNLKERGYFNNSNLYKTPHLKYDLYTIFMERGLSLLKNIGLLGFIIPYSVLNQPYAELLRKHILDTCQIISIVDLSQYYVFQDASVKTCMLILKKEESKELRNKNIVKVIKQLKYAGSIDTNLNLSNIPQSLFFKTPQYMFRLDVNTETFSFTNRLKNNSIPLGSIFYVSKGIVAYSKTDDRKKQDFIYDYKKNSTCVPYLEGRDVERYNLRYKGIFLEYDQKLMSRPTFPEVHQNIKILVRAMTKGLATTFDEKGYYADQKLICCVKRDLIERYIPPSKKPKEPLADEHERYNEMYILGILNSTFMSYYYKVLLFGGLSILPQDIRVLPIQKINFDDYQQKKTYEGIIGLVDKMLSLNKRLNEIGDKKTDQRVKIEEEIKKTDAEIDELVYKIYGITEAEKKMIEERLR